MAKNIKKHLGIILYWHLCSNFQRNVEVNIVGCQIYQQNFLETSTTKENHSTKVAKKIFIAISQDYKVRVSSFYPTMLYNIRKG